MTQTYRCGEAETSDLRLLLVVCVHTSDKDVIERDDGDDDDVEEEKRKSQSVFSIVFQ